MTALFRRRATAVWAGLVLATVASWALGSSHGTSMVEAATTVTLLIAFVKVAFVGWDFMEIRHADALLRYVFAAWLLLVGGTVVGLYVFA